MSERAQNKLTRREFVKAGTSLAAVAATAPLLIGAEQRGTKPAPLPTEPLPTRPLGKSGLKITTIMLGTYAKLPDRLFDHAYAQGVRAIDTSVGYGGGKSEAQIAKWFERTGKRKEIFLITKDLPKQVEGHGDVHLLLRQVDKRLEALKTDYIDALLVHGIGPKEYGPTSLIWPKSNQFKAVCEKLKKSGKVKLVGFACHDHQAAQYLAAAAEGGFVDVILVQYNPVLGKPNDALNRALDACYKAGIGLIAMKTVRGISRQLPADEKTKLTVPQRVIQAVLSDERIASICSAMKNIKQIDQNTAAARLFKRPMTEAEIDQLRRTVLAAGVTYCPGCEACSCGIAGTTAEISEIIRYLSYYEQDGQHALARRLYRSLPPAARNVSGADLEAARFACACRLDFAALLARAERKLA